MPTVLVTGANRGIGLEHVRQALESGESVIACCRKPHEAVELQSLLARYGPDVLKVEALDVASGDSVAALAARLKDVPIDILINNAGLYGHAPWPEGARLQSLEDMDYDLWDDILCINLVGPFRMTAALMPNLLRSDRKLVAMMSSELGSIGQNKAGTSHAYRSSKAALNMLARGLAIDLKDKGVTVIALAPGWTQTDLGGAGAQWPVADSVSSQRKVLAKAGPDDSGQFINLTGETLPW